MTTLKSLVDETTNIKNELKTCHTNLENNLVAKGVEVGSDEKLSNLIDYVAKLEIPNVSIVAGNSKIFYSGGSKSTYMTQYQLIHSYQCLYNGTYRVTSKTRNGLSGNDYRIGIRYLIQIVRNDSVVKEVEFGHTDSNVVTKIDDISDIKKHDYIKFYILKFNSQYSGSVVCDSVVISGDGKWNI